MALGAGNMTNPDDKSLLDELFGDAQDGEAPNGSVEIAESLDEDRAEDRAEPPPPSGPPRTRETPAPPEMIRHEAERRPPWWMRSAGRGDPAVAPGCREIGLTTTGFVIFVSVDSVMMYTPFRISGPTNLLPQAIALLFLAFGLGALMIWSIRGAWRPVGIGMMLGWVFMTLISAGYFTGLNP